MGDWCTAIHWFEGPPEAMKAVLAGLRRAARRHPWRDPERWALRAGRCAPGLVQAESVQKYGATLDLAAHVERGDVRVLQLCEGYGLAIDDPRPGILGLRCNYLLAPADHDLSRMADVLGELVARAPDGGPRLLCLRAPSPLPVQPRSWSFAELEARADPLAALVVALTLADPRVPGRTTEHLLGHHSREHGWIHLARLRLALDGRGWRHSGSVTVELDGGVYNPVPFEFAAGPHAHSNHFARPQAASLAGAAWPA